jgi:hypothetical protein
LLLVWVRKRDGTFDTIPPEYAVEASPGKEGGEGKGEGGMVAGGEGESPGKEVAEKQTDESEVEPNSIRRGTDEEEEGSIKEMKL